MSKSNSKTNGGVGFCGLLTIALIVLKLTNFITWSWWIVTAPMWAPVTIILFFSFLFCIIAVVKNIREEIKKRRATEKTIPRRVA